MPIFGGDAYGNFTDFIEINECAPDTTGAGPTGCQRVLDHGLGHAQGFDRLDHDDTMLSFALMWGV
jgi:hypothetical protein